MLEKDVFCEIKCAEESIDSAEKEHALLTQDIPKIVELEKIERDRVTHAFHIH